MNDITAILTCYRRPHLLERQIKSLWNQTHKPKEIWIWKNYHEDNQLLDVNNLYADAVFDNNVNWKYCGRFACSLLAKTKFIALFDDDTIPGPRWFENCLKYQDSPNVLGGAGIILKNNQYFGHDRTGWPAANETLTEVDLVGHAWFFRQDLAKLFWLEPQFTQDTGEDIHFSYMCQKYGNIKTYCPPHPMSKKDVWSSLYPRLGVDDKTISVTDHAKFFGLRNNCVETYIRHGWKPLFMRN